MLFARFLTELEDITLEQIYKKHHVLSVREKIELWFENISEVQ